MLNDTRIQKSQLDLWADKSSQTPHKNELSLVHSWIRNMFLEMNSINFKVTVSQLRWLIIHQNCSGRTAVEQSLGSCLWHAIQLSSAVCSQSASPCHALSWFSCKTLTLTLTTTFCNNTTLPLLTGRSATLGGGLINTPGRQRRPSMSHHYSHTTPSRDLHCSLEHPRERTWQETEETMKRSDSPKPELREECRAPPHVLSWIARRMRKIATMSSAA